MARVVYYNFIFWIILKGFMPFIHPDPRGDLIRPITSEIALIANYIPVLLGFYYWIYHMANERQRTALIWRPFKLNYFIIFGFVCTFVIVIGQIYSMSVQQIAAHGSLITWGLMVATTMAIAYKLKDKGPLGIMMGLMAGFFVIGFFEAPYQIARYFIHNHITQDNLFVVLFRQLLFTAPFIIAVIISKVRLTRYSLLLIGIYLILWAIWLCPGHYWTLYVIVDGRSALNEYVNWPIYHVAKLCKVVLCLFVFTMDYKRVK